MAPPQAHQPDYLRKVGLEGFALVDEYGDPKKSAGMLPSTQAYDHHRHNYHHQYNNHNQQLYVYHGPQIITVTEPVIDSNLAAQIYGGVAVVDHSIRTKIRRHINC